MNSLRMEKAYRAWGLELTNEVTMIEGAMERFIDLAKDFVGKAGTLKSKEDGPRIQLVYLEVAATDPDCRGNEPVYHDGRLVGITTGGAYGHAVGSRWPSPMSSRRWRRARASSRSSLMASATRRGSFRSRPMIPTMRG